MIRKITLAAFFAFFLLQLNAQQKPLEREVTLYNPYKPSLNEARKKSYLPDIADTAKFRPEFGYEVTATPFMPVYTVNPIKAATLQPDPLNKLYRSYVNLGIGSNTSTLAEVSITNERSKKGAIGFYGRHFSNNGSFTNDLKQKINSGYMDNDLSFFGKKFYKGGVIAGSVDYKQRSRHAYGFVPEEIYVLGRKDTKLRYNDFGAEISVASAKLDSSSYAYDFNVRYDYFNNKSGLPDNLFTSNEKYNHYLGIKGEMSKSFNGFYVGSGLEIENYKLPVTLLPHSKYIAALNPFISKSSSQWNFRLGMQALIERNLKESAKLHIYPDVHFGFNMVPSYINFFAALEGNLEKNDPLNVIEENPFLLPDGSLFVLPFSDNKLIVSTGFRGNSGIEGTYELSASYSLASDMLFFYGFMSGDSLSGRGNYFKSVVDDVDVLRLHGAMNGKLTDKLSFSTGINFYRYTLTLLEHPWNKPNWDASLSFKYNLRDKIIAGVDVKGIGERKQIIEDSLTGPVVTLNQKTMPVHFSMNIMAEYRYSNILSFWARVNEMSYKRYYEWTNYPSHMFQFMVGFTYSL
ncbi:MAG TPA: hypothetical protein VHO50_02210 [Bacteroidales bacterium]|nr:hypothetical protein [Bacteroidales bacterium]